MEDISIVLQVVTYIFTIALLIIGIIIGIKVIGLSDKVDKLLDDLQDKATTLNGAFNVVNKFSTGMDLVSSKIINTITSLISKIIKKKEDEDENE